MTSPRKYTGMIIDEVAIKDHSHLISLAEDGNFMAAQALMADAAILLQHGLPLPEPLGTYIREALYKAALFDHPNGLPLDEAFHIKKGRGRNKTIELTRAHLICMEVQLHWLTSQRYETKSDGELGAYEVVANRYNYKDTESIRKLFERNHKKWNIKGMTEDKLQELIPTYQKLLRIPDK